MDGVARGCCLSACFAMALGPALSAADWTVGPGQAFERIEAALGQARSGDAILVLPRPGNLPYERVALSVGHSNLVIRAVGQRIPLSGEGGDYSGIGSVPRAIVQFNPGADGCVLEGFELSGAHNRSHNGAGVRINQANDVTVRGCHIHGNDMGVMSNGGAAPHAAQNQLIENCLVCRNGDPEEPGQNHNLYLGGASVTLRGCEVHSSLTGHNVKSRAHRTLVLACYVHDSANREFDLVDGRGDTEAPGSDAVLAGNVIAKARACPGNRAVIQFGQDGGGEHDGTLFLLHNTIVTPFASPVVQLSAPKARAQLFNNIVWDGGARQRGQCLALAENPSADARVAGAGNWLSAGFGGDALDRLPLRQTALAAPSEDPPFADAAHGDYALERPAPRITGTGGALPNEALQALGGPLPEYRAPQSSAARPATDKPDLGAVAWRGAPAKGK